MTDQTKALDLSIRQGSTFAYTVRWEVAPVVYVPITGITQAAPASITAPAHGAPNGWRVAITNAKGMTAINAASTPPKDKDYHYATVVDANTITLNDVNAAGFTPYVSGGYLQYNTPKSLVGYTAKMNILSPAPAVQYYIKCTIGGTSGLSTPVPVPVTSTSTFTDNSVTWAVLTGVTGNYPVWAPNTAYTANTIVILNAGATVYESLTSVNGGIVLDTTANTITLNITATETGTYTWTNGIYDLKLISAAGVVTTLLRGNVTVYNDVTI